jgi:hypothetical protein
LEGAGGLDLRLGMRAAHGAILFRLRALRHPDALHEDSEGLYGVGPLEPDENSSEVLEC